MTGAGKFQRLLSDFLCLLQPDSKGTPGEVPEFAEIHNYRVQS